MFVISDNIDTQMGLRLAGIDGVVVHEREEVLKTLDQVMQDEEIGIIYLTGKIIATCPEVISELKLKTMRPLLVEIPDRHGSTIGETIDAYVSEAVGVKMQR